MVAGKKYAVCESTGNGASGSVEQGIPKPQSKDEITDIANQPKRPAVVVMLLWSTQRKTLDIFTSGVLIFTWPNIYQLSCSTY